MNKQSKFRQAMETYQNLRKVRRGLPKAEMIKLTREELDNMLYLAEIAKDKVKEETYLKETKPVTETALSKHLCAALGEIEMQRTKTIWFIVFVATSSVITLALILSKYLA